MAPQRFAFGPFVLDAGNGALFEHGLPVSIGSKPLALLQALVVVSYTHLTLPTNREV